MLSNILEWALYGGVVVLLIILMIIIFSTDGPGSPAGIATIFFIFFLVAYGIYDKVTGRSTKHAGGEMIKQGMSMLHKQLTHLGGIVSNMFDEEEEGGGPPTNYHQSGGKDPTPPQPNPPQDDLYIP